MRTAATRWTMMMGTNGTMFHRHSNSLTSIWTRAHRAVFCCKDAVIRRSATAADAQQAWPKCQSCVGLQSHACEGKQEGTAAGWSSLSVQVRSMTAKHCPIAPSARQNAAIALLSVISCDHSERVVGSSLHSLGAGAAALLPLCGSCSGRPGMLLDSLVHVQCESFVDRWRHMGWIGFSRM